jgi:hypothetical protein
MFIVEHSVNVPDVFVGLVLIVVWLIFTIAVDSLIKSLQFLLRKLVEHVVDIQFIRLSVRSLLGGLG